jgi:muramoyltetrapeptide carboxypeptidase
MGSELQTGKCSQVLRPQSTIGVVSLASCVERSALEAGCSALRTVTDCKVEVSPTALNCEDDFAGSPAVRAAALMEMWRREDVSAIVCTRGGYGANYLLPLLDFEALKSKPKVFVGYSDNTSLLLALERAGITSFHGPMVASDFAKGCVDEVSFLKVLRGEALGFAFGAGSKVRSLVAGEGRGTIVGGCLSVVVTSLGTPWEIETDGKILFLEDVNERPFRIDRMLMHLLLAGKFRGVRGVIFGAMLGCFRDHEEEEMLQRVILRILGGLGVPIVFGFPSGHVESGNITLPFGVPAVVHSEEPEVQLNVEASACIQARENL